MGQKVGDVTETWLYPVKGMQGVQADSITTRSISVIGDRRIAFSEIDGRGTPTLLDTTKYPGLLRYRPSFVDPRNPKTSEIIVTAPDGKEYEVNDPILLERISNQSGRNLAILRLGRGTYHSMPVSLISLGSIKEISNQANQDIDPRVFRMNVYITVHDDIPFKEDTWIGKVLIFGDKPDSPKLNVVKLDERCATINMNPETGEQNPKVLKVVVKSHNKTLGIYCGIFSEGIIDANSPIYLASLAEG